MGRNRKNPDDPKWNGGLQSASVTDAIALRAEMQQMMAGNTPQNTVFATKTPPLSAIEDTQKAGTEDFLVEEEISEEDLRKEGLLSEVQELPQLPDLGVRATDVMSMQNRNPGDLLESTLSQPIETDSHVKSVSKELFSHQSIALKTEVSHDEINMITRLHFLRTKFSVSNVDVLVDNFLELRVSKDRKSRGEFISSLQTENRNAQGGGFMSRLFGGGNTQENR